MIFAAWTSCYSESPSDYWLQRYSELEKDSIYNKYIDKVGVQSSTREVYQIWKKEMLLLDDEGNELLLPKTEQIPSDFIVSETAPQWLPRVDKTRTIIRRLFCHVSPVFPATSV